MDNQYESLQEYTREELRQVYDSLGLYIPADVTNKSQIGDYYLLFDALRVLHLGYGVLNKQEVVEKFYEYYNATEDGKKDILMPLKNWVLDLNYQDEFDEDTMIEETTEAVFRAYEMIRKSDEKYGKLRAAEFLYLIENGKSPQPEEDISNYYKTVEEYDERMKLADEEAQIYREQILMQLQNRMQPEILPQYEALTPEEVAAKYLKGAGVVDPASRNSGFRVDRDVNFDE